MNIKKLPNWVCPYCGSSDIKMHISLNPNEAHKPEIVVAAVIEAIDDVDEDDDCITSLNSYCDSCGEEFIIDNG